MEMCRACLIAENNMIPLDENFIYNYNLLTSLNVSICDGMPQYFCVSCTTVLKSFLEFREKARTSETTLRELVEDIKPEDLLSENKPNIEDTDSIKIEIKTEFTLDPDTLDDYISDHYTEENLESDNKDHDLMGIIPKKLKRTKIKNEKKKNKSKTEKKHVINKCAVSKKARWKKSNIREDNVLSCGLCNTTFERREMNNHLETHKKNAQCEICLEKFYSWQEMFGHRILHLPTDECRCHLCNKRFDTCAGLEYHYLRTHSDKQIVSSKCKICLKSFSNPIRLKKHISRTHTANKCIFICDYCSKRFNCKQNLKIHISTHYDVKAFACKLCEFSTKLRTGLNDHMVRKHAPEKVTCGKCKRIFKNQKIHDKHKCNVKNIVCPICGKEIVYGKGGRLTRHLASHDPVGRFKCPRCPNTYRVKGALTAHLNRHDGVRAFRCERCPAAFYSGSSLVRHRRTHTGEKPYVCKTCNRAFMSNSNMKTHMKIHGQFVINHKNKDDVNKTEETKTEVQ